MKKRALVAIAIAVVLLALFVVAVGWEEVLNALARASGRIYLLAIVATGVGLLCRSLVWHRLLTIVDRPRPYWLVTGLFLTSMFGKYVAPYGQVASGVGVAALVSRYYDSAYEEALAAVVSADFINYLPYYTLGSVGLGYVVLVYSPPIGVGQYVPMVAAVIVGLLVLVALLWVNRKVIGESLLGVSTALGRLLERFAPRRARHFRRRNVTKRFDGFYTTLDLVSRDRRAIGLVCVYAHVGWLMYAAVLYISAVAIGQPIPFGVAMLAVALSKVGFVVPTPGGLGGVEAALAGALVVLLPMSGAIAVAIALLYRLGTYWFTILVGGIASILLSLKDPLPPETN